VTLAISVHQRDPNSGELGPDLVVEIGADLAGFENWRTAVYGAAAVQQRGARFLPRLATGDLTIEGADLLVFREECTVLLRDVAQLAIDLGVGVETLRFRIANMVAATDQAISVGGVVWIS
jgi:hypothetical protein